MPQGTKCQFPRLNNDFFRFKRNRYGYGRATAADAASAIKERAADTPVAWAEYQTEHVALNSSMERLRAERLAREAEGHATKPKKKTMGPKRVS